MVDADELPVASALLCTIQDQDSSISGFHVKHCHRRMKHATPAGPSTRSTPTALTSAGSQRSPIGGSLITTKPPGRTQSAATLRVTTGGPKPRATTASNTPSVAPARSASIVNTETRPSHSSRRTILARKSVRVLRRSSNVITAEGMSWEMTNPGTPPPAPRSSTETTSAPDGGANASRARTNRRAWSTTSMMGRPPRNPRRCDSSKTATSARETGRVGSDGVLMKQRSSSDRFDDDASSRIFAH